MTLGSEQRIYTCDGAGQLAGIAANAQIDTSNFDTVWRPQTNAIHDYTIVTFSVKNSSFGEIRDFPSVSTDLFSFVKSCCNAA